MGIFQIKFNLSLSIGYTPIIAECVENVNGLNGPLGNVRYFHLVKVSNMVTMVRPFEPWSTTSIQFESIG